MAAARALSSRSSVVLMICLLMQILEVPLMHHNIRTRSSARHSAQPRAAAHLANQVRKAGLQPLESRIAPERIEKRVPRSERPTAPAGVDGLVEPAESLCFVATQ